MPIECSRFRSSWVVGANKRVKRTYKCVSGPIVSHVQRESEGGYQWTRLGRPGDLPRNVWWRKQGSNVMNKQCSGQCASHYGTAKTTAENRAQLTQQLQTWKQLQALWALKFMKPSDHINQLLSKLSRQQHDEKDLPLVQCKFTRAQDFCYKPQWFTYPWEDNILTFLKTTSYRTQACNLRGRLLFFRRVTSSAAVNRGEDFYLKPQRHLCDKTGGI